MAHDLFISYSTEDKPAADAVCAILEKNGVRCWIAPRDIMPGTDWGESIVKGIRSSRVLLLVFSTNANKSKQIKREVECAADAGVTIVPLRIENILPTESFKYFLGNIHWLDALTPPLEKHLQEVAAKVKAILSAESVSLPETSQPSSPANAPTVQLPARRNVLPLIGGIIAVLLATSVLFFVLWRPKPGTSLPSPTPVELRDPGTKNLVSFWPLQGSIEDSRHENDGRLLGNAKFAQVAKSGTVLRLFGLGDGFVASTKNLPVGNEDRTLSMWVRFDRLPEGDSEALFAAYGMAGISRNMVALGYKRNLKMFVSNWGDAVYADKYEGEVVTGCWYFVSATYSADRNRLYLDSQLVNSLSQMQFETPPQSEFRLGFIDRSDIQRQLIGELSEVRIYSRALTETEIRFLNQSGYASHPKTSP